MTVYLDDNVTWGQLAAMLTKAGHQVIFPAATGTAGASDARHLIAALTVGAALLTRNYGDFEDLHAVVRATAGTHAGIILIRQDNDPSRDMLPREIVTAIGKLERSGVSVANELIVLNHWR